MPRRALTALTLSVLLAACASGPTFEKGVFDDGIVRYRVGALPASFRRVEVDDNDLAWNDPDLGTIGINATCTEYEDVPETALINHLLFGTAERTFRVEETTTLDGRGARHVVVDLELDGVPMTIAIYLVRKDGCVYDLTFIAARDRFEQSRATFAAFAQAFAVLQTRLPD
jgi:hypothetical protein